jgi:hypothetical protein
MGCFLDEQAGADLDLAADTEGVDALISGGLMSSRANESASYSSWCHD